MAVLGIRVKRFVFDLDGLLKLKRHRERLAELRHAQAAQALAAAQSASAAIRRQLDLTSAYVLGRVGRAQDAGAWLAAYLQADRLEQKLDAGARVVEDARQALDRAAEARRQAAVEAESLRSLRERRWQEYLQDYRKAEQERLDEVGLRRWQAGRPAADSPGGDR